MGFEWSPGNFSNFQPGAEVCLSLTVIALLITPLIARGTCVLYSEFPRFPTRTTKLYTLAPMYVSSVFCFICILTTWKRSELVLIYQTVI